MAEENNPSKTEEEEERPPPLKLTCPCRRTTVVCTGPIVAAGVCHCNECRILSQGIAFEGVCYPNGTVETLEGALEHIKRPDLEMTVHACADCHCMLYHTEIHSLEIVASSEIRRCHGGKLPSDHYKATCHCNYRERVFDIKDELPKFANSPMADEPQMVTWDGKPIAGGEA